MISRCIFLFGFLFLKASCQDCPNLWVPHEDFCYYFSDNAIDHEIGMTWTEAEAYCQGFGGHLTSYATPQERDWVYNSYLSKWPDTHWWIGLNDIKQEGTFEWSDGTTYEDTYVSFWKPQEPSNSGKEDCIEVWVQLPLYKGRWNDNQCDKVNPFVCKKPVGTPVASCPVGWTQNGEKCYKAIDSERNWQEANKDCKLQGSVLVSVTSADQEAFVETLMTPYANVDFWLGYSDTNTPGTLQWANPGATSTSYDNWAPSQPPTPLPYTGSTCATFANGLSYQWSTGKCSQELKYICERGLSNRCPPGWVLLGQKCYELVINENRLQTWPVAMETCKLAGATLLKIESEEEQTFIGSALVQYKGAGYQEIWLGGSDFARDETFAWADSTPISQFYWDTGMPRTVSGREDCLNLYTGKTTNNWETSNCFHERPFICQLPVGATLPSAPVISVEGKCDDGWRHFEGYCYLIGPSEETQSTASNYCTQNGGNLASILTAAEESFLVGLIQSESWIGLTKSGNFYTWVDNQQLSFQNWASSAPKTNQCVYLRESGTWYDENCSTAKYFICKKTEIKTAGTTISPTPGNPGDAEKCGDSTWISNPASTQCYFLNAVQLRSWNDARHTCQSIGGDLASINTPEEQAFLFAATTLLPTVSEMWIGGSDWNDWNDLAGLVANGWEWSDGSPFNYLNWNDGEPNNADTENCVELYVSSGRWNDQSCEGYRHFICEKQGTTSSIIGVDVADDDCKSNEACCFKHIGVEKGGVLDDSVLSASTEADENFNAARGRLNTPADVIIINDQIKVGTGHGAWEPTGSDSAPWLQVDLPRYMEIKGIITQGRNGIIQYSERQWTKKYKIGYSQDQRHTGSQVIDWEMLSDDAGNPIIFDGNSDQDTQVTNLFPRPIIARHLRCYPVEWKDRAALRIEYIGCKASCLNKLGLNSGYIKDSMITASSSANGKTPVQARAPVDKTDCLSSTSDDGSNYRGWVAKTVSGKTCQRWDSQSPHSHQVTSETNPDADLRNNYCRTPDTGGNSPKGGPWCYTTDIKVEQEICPISICPSYTPTGWSPAQTNDQQYVQVQFEDFYKVSGITLYGSTSTYVSRYALWFSDDGTNFKTYKNQIGQDHLFYGLDGVESEYTDILREPISTKYVRVQPKQWVGGIVMQFEVLGCYVDGRITCADIGSDFSPAEGSSSILIDCPSGCVEDTSQGLVYGTDVYTEHSAICPAAVHAGRVTNNHGGTVTVVKTSGQTEYRGSYKNGITSLDYDESHLSLTFDGSVYRCDDGWTPWKDHCYYLSPKNVFKNWQDARADCISMGADLSSIHSSGENDFHEYIITQGDRGRDVWIGMNDLRTQNYYQWADDTVVDMTKWNVGEPNGGGERCVEIYRLFGFWNDKECESEISFICKKEKQYLPPLDPEDVPVDEGCEAGWRAYGSSCYQTSDDEYMFIYANRHCEEKNAKLVSVHDDYEQAFIHSLITNSLPPNLGYTAWLGLSAKTLEDGQLIYEWESGESVTYTHWDIDEPDVRFSCAIPWTFKGNTYYGCITFDHPARLEDTPWCSITPVYKGQWINCDTGYEYGCTFMDDQTGFWQIDICGQNRYYVCEKDRNGFTQPVDTTPSTAGTCDTSNGWVGDTRSGYCYQIHEYLDDDREKRLSWPDAVDFCQAQGADLVSIHSEDDMIIISDFVMQKPVYSYVYFWLGLNNVELSQGYQWTDGSPVDFTYWNSGEPNNHQGLENCVESQLYDQYSGWNDLNCDATRNYICKIRKDKKPSSPPTLPPPAGNEDIAACGTNPDGTWIRYQVPDTGDDKCYMFIDSINHGWQYAENDCITKGGHLVAIQSADENSFILSRGYQTTAQALWIGLRNSGGSAFYWADGSPYVYTNWSPGEPNNYYDSEGCVTISPDGGLWNDDNCGRTFGYVCEKIIGSTGGQVDPTPQATGNCPTGFSPYGNNCYITGGENTYTWETAREWCKNNSAELVVIGNEYEQSFLNNYLYEKGSTFWIGLSDRFTGSGQFVWIDQSEVAYTNWAPGEPDGSYEGCAVISPSNDGYWADADCYGYNQFVCSVRKSTSNPAPPNTQSPIGCKNGYLSSTHEEACYKLMDGAMSWDDARKACQAEGSKTDLVSVTEIYDNDLIKSWFWRDITSGDSMWLGMSFVVVTSANGATSVQFTWADGWPTSYTNWALNEPSTDATDFGSGCVLMNRDGSWSAVPTTSTGASCATSLPFVCKQTLGTIPTTPVPGTGTCDPGFFAYGDYCYLINFGTTDATSRSWFESAIQCEERGAALASFHNIEEVQAVIGTIGSTTSHNLFIGMSSNGFDGWQWKDGTAADFFNWGNNEPNGQDGEECVEMYPWDGTWNDVSCYEDRGYVCRTTQGNTKCSVANVNRYDCGYEGIDEYQCVSRRGCCFDASFVSVQYNISGCYYPEGTIIGPSGLPVTVNPSKEPVTGNGLSAGAIVGIVIGVLVVIVLIAGGVYFFRGSSGKSMPSVSMPSFTMPKFTSSTKSPSSNAETSKGFDNPMALSDNGEFHSVA